MSVSNKIDAATRSWSNSDEPGGIISNSKTEASVRTWTNSGDPEGMVSSRVDESTRVWDEPDQVAPPTEETLLPYFITLTNNSSLEVGYSQYTFEKGYIRVVPAKLPAGESVIERLPRGTVPFRITTTTYDVLLDFTFSSSISPYNSEQPVPRTVYSASYLFEVNGSATVGNRYITMIDKA